MRKIVVLVTTAAFAAGLTLAAAPAGARVADKGNKKLCTLLTSITIDPSSDPTSEGGRENAGEYAKALRKAAKKAKGDIKKTLRTLASFYQRIADNDSPEDIAEDGEEFGRATTKYAAYIVKNCLGDISVPDISIPDIG